MIFIGEDYDDDDYDDEFYDDYDDEDYDDEDYDDEPCHHDCDEGCRDYQGFNICHHQHCFNCGGCQCPGYCDDYQTYNLRPAETGGAPDG